MRFTTVDVGVTKDVTVTAANVAVSTVVVTALVEEVIVLLCYVSPKLSEFRMTLTYIVGGVTVVVPRKLLQSSNRELIGILTLVPVTPRAQRSALHTARSPMTLADAAMAKAGNKNVERMMRDRNSQEGVQKL